MMNIKVDFPHPTTPPSQPNTNESSMFSVERGDDYCGACPKPKSWPVTKKAWPEPTTTTWPEPTTTTTWPEPTTTTTWEEPTTTTIWKDPTTTTWTTTTEVTGPASVS